MTIVPCAAWEPDKPPLANGTSIALNVVPRVPDGPSGPGSYGPFLSPAQYVSGALDAAVLGSGPAVGSGGAQYFLAGTTAKLWEVALNPVGSWVNVSGATYTTAAGENWRFAQFKNLILATNNTDAIQSKSIPTGFNFATLAAAAPKARYIAAVKDFVFVGYTTDPIGGNAPYRAWWCAIGDPTNWPAPGTAEAQAVESDYNDFTGERGSMTGFATGLANADVAIFFQHGITLGQYVGPPNIFDFQDVQGAQGNLAPNSLVTIGNLTYYYSTDGFRRFDGISTYPIGFGRVDRWFKANFAGSSYSSIIGAYDATERVIRWQFPSSASPDTQIMYSPECDRWSYAKVTSEWIGSMFLTDTSASIGCFSAGHVLDRYTGTALAATVSTSEAQLTQGARSRVRMARPLVDGAAPTVAVATRNRLEDAQVTGADVAMNSAGVCPQRADGRYVQGIIKIPAAATWTHAQGLDFTAQPSGMR